MKQTQRWLSARLDRELTLVRWGEIGAPVLYFPTAGGDAEEIERFGIVDALAPLLEQGKIKLYSVDSVFGQTWLREEGSLAHRMWVQNQYHHALHEEVVPAIDTDCRQAVRPLTVAGASLGAFTAAALVCRFPHTFARALCLSGTFALDRFFAPEPATLDFYYSSPLCFLPHLEVDETHPLRRCFIQFAAGEGRAENLGESHRLARTLEYKGIPHRIDNWGKNAHHDWPLWRKLAPHYLAAWA